MRRAAKHCLRGLRPRERGGLPLLHPMRRQNRRSRARRSSGVPRSARAPRRCKRRAPPTHRDVLRSGRLDRAVDPHRSGRSARRHRRLPHMRGRRGRALRRLRRQIHGRRRVGLFRLPASARGRRRQRRARRLGDHRGDRRARGGEGRHQVRIGIATGLVVVGELVGSGEAQERDVVGETPNLAARLQSAAAPNTVLIAASTRRLTGDLFEYEPVDPGALKGFAGRSRPGACCASRACRAASSSCARRTRCRWSAAARSSIFCRAAGHRPKTMTAAWCCCRASPASASRG